MTRTSPPRHVHSCRRNEEGPPRPFCFRCNSRNARRLPHPSSTTKHLSCVSCRARHHPALFEQEKTPMSVFSCLTDPLSTTRRPSWVSGCVQWPPAPLEQEKTPNGGVFSCSKLSRMEPFMGFFLARSLLNTNRHSFWGSFGAHR